MPEGYGSDAGFGVPRLVVWWLRVVDGRQRLEIGAQRFRVSRVEEMRVTDRSADDLARVTVCARIRVSCLSGILVHGRSLRGAGRVASYIFFVPLVSLVIGAVYLHETLGPSLLAGAALVIVGVYLVNRPPADARGTPPEASSGRH